MPVSRLVDHGTPDSVATVQELVLSKIALVRELTVARSGTRQPVIQRVSVRLEDGEDRHKIARQAAEEAIDIAMTDADGKTRTYVFTVYGDAPEDRMPPNLGSVSVRIRNEDDEDERAPASTTKAAAKIVADVGDRHVKLLDQQLGMLDRVLNMATSADQLGASRARAEGDTQIKLTELAIGREERKEIIQLCIVGMPLFNAIGAGIADFFRAKAEEARARAKAAG
jgi:hypothetical protein